MNLNELIDTDFPDFDTSKIKENSYVLTDKEYNKELTRGRKLKLP